MAPNRRMVDSFLKSPLKMRHALRTTSKPHLLAEVVPPPPADTALATWYPYFERHSITNIEASDIWPDGHYHTRRLMAKGQRCACTKISIGKLLIIAHIRATNAG